MGDIYQQRIPDQSVGPIAYPVASNTLFGMGVRGGAGQASKWQLH